MRWPKGHAEEERAITQITRATERGVGSPNHGVKSFRVDFDDGSHLYESGWRWSVDGSGHLIIRFEKPDGTNTGYVSLRRVRSVNGKNVWERPEPSPMKE